MAEISFAGRCVIVTGAGNGFGRDYALELARRGASVVVNDLGTSVSGDGSSPRAADHTVAEIRSAGGVAIASHDSAATVEGTRSIVEVARREYGRVDAVILNAGILRNAPLAELTDVAYRAVMDVHLDGAFYLSRAVFPIMQQEGYGRFVFVSSGSGLFGRLNGMNYAAAKSGVVGMCNALALEGAPHGILANVVIPIGATRLAGAPDVFDQSPEAERRRGELLEPGSRRSPSWVTPMTVYLASEACDRTHRYYGAGLGRFNRVFVGSTRGWEADGPEPPTPEDVAGRLDLIEDTSAYDIPLSGAAFREAPPT